DINSVAELARQEPKPLADRIQALLASKQVSIVGTGVTAKRTQEWIKEARRLAPPPPSPGAEALRKVAAEDKVPQNPLLTAKGVVEASR
ncbi:hypothetical protein WFJ45_23110, partial [Salmonella enterica subsp. enterica serovar Minnesota]|uniref:hypothetical protein n=1 Tax=Salmonella enterica TaxID=28901 RepID=UPI003D2C208C